jgi:predicted amidophosphoribosyltransferase
VSETISCAACGSANETDRKFCGECGTPLAQTCPSCGTPNAPSVKFCGETLLEHGELIGDTALLDEAREIFEQLGATPWLARLERARSHEEVTA